MGINPVLPELDELPRSHPLLGCCDGGVRFPQRGALGMKARPNWDRVIIFLPVIPRPFEHFAEGQDGWRGLVLSWINPSGEGVRDLRRVAVIHKSRESERLFPEQVDHVFKVRFLFRRGAGARQTGWLCRAS